MVYNNCANPNNNCSKYIDKIVEGGTITYISGSGEGELVASDTGTLIITPSVISGLSLCSNSISYEWSRVIKVDTNNNNNLTGNLLVSYPKGHEVYAKLCIYNPQILETVLLGINVNVAGGETSRVDPIYDSFGLACWEDLEGLYPPSYTINGISSNIRLEKLNVPQCLFGNLDDDCSSNAINLKMPSRGETGNLKLSILGTTTGDNLSVRIMVEYIIQNINDKYILNIIVSSEKTD
jgi:hypothetical protein